MDAHAHHHHGHHDHHDNHGHGHHHDRPSGETQALLAFLVTFTFMLFEAAGGLISGSLALLADAAHMLTDALALLLAWAAFRVGRIAADPKRTYGYRRAEVLAALANGLTVVALAGWIGWEAIERITNPQPIDALPMLAVAVLGFIANLAALKILHAGHDHGHPHANLNLRGAALHVMGDLLGSLAAAIGAVVILATGWTVIDPALSLLVAGLILFGAVKLIADSANILLEGTPPDFDEDALRTHLVAAVPGLTDVHHVHAWSITSGHSMLTLHAEIDATAQHDTVLAAIKRELAERFSYEHSVVQVERQGCGDEGCA